MILDTKLAGRLNTKLDAEDDRAVQMMASGMLADWGAYQRSAGYRKAISDCKLLIEQTLEELMKE